MINYGKQFLDQEDFKSVLNSLKSEKITQGSKINIFENSLKKKIKM